MPTERRLRSFSFELGFPLFSESIQSFDSVLCGNNLHTKKAKNITESKDFFSLQKNMVPVTDPTIFLLSSRILRLTSKNCLKCLKVDVLSFNLTI